MSKLNPQTKRRIQLPDAAFFLAFVCLLAYFIFLAPYGWAGSDEAFYVAEPYRFVQGDCFFTDDWNCGQLFAFALIPLMKLRLALEPSTDGIILSFRYYYVAISAAVTLFIYLRGRRISPWGALFAALFLFVYSPLGIRNMSYNVMGLMSLALVCVLMLTAEKHPAADMYFAGVFVAVLVLNCPFAVAIYIIYALAVLVLTLMRKRGRVTGEGFGGCAFMPRSLMWSAFGAGTLFILFCAFVFSRASLGEILGSFQYVFGDPEHRPEPLTWLIKNVIYCTITSSRLALGCLAACVVLAAAIFFDKRRLLHRKLYLAAAAVLTVVYCLPFVRSNISNELMLPLNILGLTAYVLSEKRQKKIFTLMFVPGLVYAVCMHHSSSLRYLALCSGASICTAASAFFICDLAGELLAEYRDAGKGKTAAGLMLGAMCLLLVSQLGIEVYVTYSNNFFHDENFAMLDTRIDRGVQKGLITSREHAEDYYALLDDTEEMRNAEGDYVLYVSDTVWLPLGDAKRSANNSLWTNYDKPEPSARRLREYLELYPEKRPEYIYVTGTLTYTYQDDIDGMVIVDILNIENRPVEKTATGYIIKMN